MENLFGLIKQEIYYCVIYYSYDELKSEIEQYIKYYNEQRIKEKLGWLVRCNTGLDSWLHKSSVAAI